jgi:hypothetical protein
MDTKDLVYSLLLLAAALVVYFVMEHVTNMNITDQVHDIVSVDLPPDVKLGANIVSNALPLLIVVYCILNDRRTVYINRLSLMVALKSLIQFVTVVPGPEYSGSCASKNSFDTVTSGICADMMFSGHTAVVFLLTSCTWRLGLVPLEAALLVLGKQHYISDTIVAAIVSSWIEYVVV